MMQPTTSDGGRSTCDLDDDKKRIKVDSSDTENSGGTDTDVEITHPAVLIVFRTENILEEICRYLEFKDLKQFRLVSKTCNEEGRRELIKRDEHWVVVKSRNEDWQLELDKVLRKEEKTSDGGEDSNQKLLGWIFKRLLLVDWRDSLSKLSILQQWGHFLRKVHLKTYSYEFGHEEEDVLSGTSHPLNTVHKLLSVCCANLDEMVVMIISYLKCSYWTPEFFNWMDDLTFPSPLLKLKCLRIKYRSVGFYSIWQMQTLQKFFTRLVTAAGTALEKLDIDFDMEELMFKDMSLNVGDGNFQCLKELTLQSAGTVSILPTTVRNNFPALAKLIICDFNYDSLKFAMEHPQNYRAFPDYFPALKSITISDIYYDHIADGRILLYLQNFPDLELLNVSASSLTYESLEFPNPVAPRSASLRSFSFKTKHRDLRLLRCVVNFFPNLITLNLLEFGTGGNDPEYSFGELMDAISSLSCLQQLYVNHAFHTSPQLLDAIQLTATLPALKHLVLVQSAHNDAGQQCNVSLYLTISDPDFQPILKWDGTWALKSLQLVDFRFGTTQQEMEVEAIAKGGGHVSFGPICSGYVEPWICGDRKGLKKCQH